MPGSAAAASAVVVADHRLRRGFPRRNDQEKPPRYTTRACTAGTLPVSPRAATARFIQNSWVLVATLRCRRRIIVRLGFAGAIGRHRRAEPRWFSLTAFVCRRMARAFVLSLSSIIIMTHGITAFSRALLSSGALHMPMRAVELTTESRLPCPLPKHSFPERLWLYEQASPLGVASSNFIRCSRNLESRV